MKCGRREDVDVDTREERERTCGAREEWTWCGSATSRCEEVCENLNMIHDRQCKIHCK